MIVKELIELLKKTDQNSTVSFQSVVEGKIYNIISVESHLTPEIVITYIKGCIHITKK